jgi:thiol-disulfide isomerase/thioredoxin
VTLVVTAIAVIGSMCCVNLLLTFGVIRRLREQANAVPQPGYAVLPDAEPAVGRSLPALAATCIDGAELTGRTLSTGSAAIGVFSTSCPPCREELPRFLTALGHLGQERVAVVVNDDGADQAALDTFREIAGSACRLVVERPLGAVTGALGVTHFPTMVLLQDGVVTANEQYARALRVPVRR